MPIKDMLERLIDYIAFFFLFDGIITGVFTLLNILFTGFSNIFGQYTNLFGYYPSSIYILILNIVVAISSILVGIGLMSKSHIARIGAIVLSIFYLIDIPFGTVTGSIIITIMIIPYSNSIFGHKFIEKNIPYRVIGVLIVFISFFTFAYLSGYAEDITTTMSIEMFGYPQSNINPMEKIKLDNLMGEKDVIIELTAPVGTYAIQQQNEVYPMIESYGGRIISSYHLAFNGFRVKIDGQKLVDIAKNPYVKSIYENGVVKLYGADDNPDFIYCLNRCNDLLNTEWLWSNGYTGKGVVVAVIDSGINEDMEWLQRNGSSVVIASYELYGDWVHWHGTTVGCCIASQHPTYKGVAPDSNLIDVEVFTLNDNGEPVAYDSDILWGYEKVAEFKEQHPEYYVIASCSFGVPSDVVGDTWSNPVPISKGANNLALKYDIPVIASAGNEGHLGFHISTPASAQYVLGVGAVDKNLHYAYFSSPGPTLDGHRKPDVSNVGVDVMTFDDDGKLVMVSGTSFSCPLTSGILADIVSKNKDKGYTVTDYYNALRYGAKDIGDVGFDYKTGYGFVDGVKSSQIVGKITPRKVFSTISFMSIFVGVGIVFYPEWGGKRKWLK